MPPAPLDPPSLQWPPKPKRGSRYTKDESLRVAYAFKDLPEWKTIEQESSDWARCMRQNLGEELYNKVFAGYDLSGNNREPSDEARRRRATLSHDVQFEARMDKGFNDADILSPSYYAPLRTKLSPYRLREELAALGDLSLYDSSADPDAILQRLRDSNVPFHNAERIISEVLGIDTDRYRAAGRPSADDVLRPGVSAKALLAQQREQRDADEQANIAKHRDYFAKARGLNQFFEEHLARGLKLQSGSLNQRLERTKIEIRGRGPLGRVANRFEAQIHVPGAAIIHVGPEMPTKELALSGLREYVAELAATPLEAATDGRFYDYIDRARERAARRAADPNRIAGARE